MDHTGFLARVPLFQDLSQGDLQRISGVCKEERLPKGAYVFHAGDADDSCYIIQQGAIKLFRVSDQRETILDILIERDLLVEMAQLRPGHVRTTSAQALDKTVMLIIHRNEFVALLQRQHAIVLRLLDAMEQRLRDANEHIENLAVLDSRHRVLRTLWWIFNKYSIGSAGDFRVAFRLTHRLLAGLSGTTRETVTRVLLELQDNHVLGFEGRSIIAIAYPDKLQAMLGSTPAVK